MRLSDYFKDVQITHDKEVLGVCSDTRKIKEGDIFFALHGSKDEGEKYASEAIERGAIAVVSDRKLCVKNNIVFNNVIEIMKNCVNTFLNYPRKGIKLIGITGTNGKTTTSHMVADILNFAGISTGIIGTLGAKWQKNKINFENTTPGFIDFMKILSQMKEDGIKCVVCEVSAHAVEQNRLFDTEFDVGVFTNLSQDHLDYFETMNAYKKAKMDFFRYNVKGYSIVNSDTQEGIEISRIRPHKTVTYGIYNPADAFAINYSQTICGEKFVSNVMDEIYNFSSAFYGTFNRYNLLAAITTCRLLGVKGKTLEDGVKSIKKIPGRFNVYKGDKTVIIDYAHTPDGLENILKACKQMTSTRIICVFGCGGDRDSSKRAQMGKISEKYADIVILTEDNSRSENTNKIIADIKSGMSTEPIILTDRKVATEYAIKIAKEDDIVLIAGKGAEEYIEKGEERILYNDAEEVKRVLGVDT